MRSTSLKFQSFPAAASSRPDARSARSNLATVLTLVAMSLGYGVVQLDVTIVNTALNSIGASLGGGVFRAAVGCQLLHHRLRRLHSDGRGARRSARRQANLHGGFCRFHGSIRRLCVRAQCRDPDRGKSGPGARCRYSRSQLPCAAQPRLHGRKTARSRGGNLGRRRQPRTDLRAVDWRRPDCIGWRSIFLVNLPIGLAGLWLSWRYATETMRHQQREVDLPGQAAAIAALGCLAGAIIEGGTLGWRDPFVIAGLAASAVLAILFVVQERRAPQPMLPLSLFRHRLFALTALVGLLVNVAFYRLIFVFSLYFQRVNGLSPFATGLAFLPMLGAVLPVNLVAARVAERIGAPATIAVGNAMAAGGCLALLGIERGTSYWAIGAQLTIIGAGLGLLVPPLTSTLLGSVEKSRSGIAAGALNSTRQTGSVLGVALFGSLAGQANAFMAGTHWSLIISACLLLAAGAVIWFGVSMKDS